MIYSFFCTDKVGQGEWEPLKKRICTALGRKKSEKTAGLLASTYSDADVICLQEVSDAMLTFFKTSVLAEKYMFAIPSSWDAVRDQNSLILLSKEVFIESSLKEVTLSQGEALNPKVGLFSHCFLPSSIWFL